MPKGNRETGRLTLQRPKPADVPDLYRFLGNRDAMRYTRADASLRECRRRIAVHERRRKTDGCAPWTARLKGQTCPIGWGGLYIDPFEPGWGIELAFFLHPDYQGRGLGFELATAALRHADDDLKLNKITAFAHRDNKPSNGLLKKLGFEPVCYLPEMQRIHFQRTRLSL